MILLSPDYRMIHTSQIFYDGDYHQINSKQNRSSKIDCFCKNLTTGSKAGDYVKK